VISRQRVPVQPPRLRPGTKRKLQPEHMFFLRELYLQDNAITYEEVVRRVWRRYGVSVSEPGVCRAMRRIGWTRQVRAGFRGERSPLSRVLFLGTIRQYYLLSPSREVFLRTLVSIDESHKDNRDLIRRYGMHPRGTRPTYVWYNGRGVRINIFGAMTRAGMIAFRITTVNGDANEGCFLGLQFGWVFAHCNPWEQAQF